MIYIQLKISKINFFLCRFFLLGKTCKSKKVEKFLRKFSEKGADPDTIIIEGYVQCAGPWPWLNGFPFLNGPALFFKMTPSQRWQMALNDNMIID